MTARQVPDVDPGLVLLVLRHGIGTEASARDLLAEVIPEVERRVLDQYAGDARWVDCTPDLIGGNPPDWCGKVPRRPGPSGVGHQHLDLSELVGMVRDMSREAGTVPHVGRRRSNLGDRVYEWLTRHYTEHISTAVVASAMRAAPTSVIRACRDTWGMPLGEIVRGMRLRKAHDMLQPMNPASYTHEGVGNVAAAVGFSGTRAFITAFRQTYGMTPREMILSNTPQAADEPAETGG